MSAPTPHSALPGGYTAGITMTWVGTRLGNVAKFTLVTCESRRPAQDMQQGLGLCVPET